VLWAVLGVLVFVGAVWGVLAFIFDLITFRSDTAIQMSPNLGPGARVLVNPSIPGRGKT